MENEKKIEGTYYESKEKDEWYGTYYTCNECGFNFMLEYDLDKCYCPGCGKYLIWNEAPDNE